MRKDATGEATRHGGVYGSDPGPSRRVRIKPTTPVSPEEQKARDAYRTELEGRAGSVTDPEISREMRRMSQRVQDSLPILEFCDRLADIERSEDDFGNVTGLEGIELRAGLRESERALREAMVYPPLLQKIVEAHRADPKVKPEDYLTADASDTDKASVEAAVSLLGLNAEKSARKPLSQEARIAKAVAESFARTGIQLSALRKELDEWKAEARARGVKFE